MMMGQRVCGSGSLYNSYAQIQKVRFHLQQLLLGLPLLPM